jgi:hypothetical protein
MTLRLPASITIGSLLAALFVAMLCCAVFADPPAGESTSATAPVDDFQPAGLGSLNALPPAVPEPLLIGKDFLPPLAIETPSVETPSGPATAERFVRPPAPPVAPARETVTLLVTDPRYQQCVYCDVVKSALKSGDPEIAALKESIDVRVLPISGFPRVLRSDGKAYFLPAAAYESPAALAAGLKTIVNYQPGQK